MTGTAFSSCGCATCRERVQSRPGCPCPECQPGPGIQSAPSVSEILGNGEMDAAEIHYCMECRAQVKVVSFDDLEGCWVHICLPKAHTWRTRSV